MEPRIFDKFKAAGLIKAGDSPVADVPSDRKALLNRKGNQLFNEGKIEDARRVFQTTGYSDGLIRVGERYLGEGKSIEALKMFYLAREKTKSAVLVERMAKLIQKFLHEEETS
jgi:hypothetical protein